MILSHFTELSEYVIQQDEEGEALLATICSLKHQLTANKEELSRKEATERTTSTTPITTTTTTSSNSTVVANGLVSTTNSLEDNNKIVGTIQRSQE